VLTDLLRRAKRIGSLTSYEEASGLNTAQDWFGIGLNWHRLANAKGELPIKLPRFGARW